MARAGNIRNIFDRDPRFVLGHRRTADGLALDLWFCCDHGARDIGCAAADVDGDIEFFGKLDGSTVHDACSEAGQFKHFVVADLSNASCFGQDTRVGRVNSIDIRVDFAGIGLEDSCQCNRSRVASASAECGDVVVFVDPLKAGSNHNIAFLQQFADPCG